MTEAGRRQRVEDICDAALQCKERDRAAYVASACCGDEALRREVEALLSHTQRAEDFLATPIGAVAADVLTDQRPSLVGRHIGVYQILSLLGAGGMGDVYRARDTNLRREVAIKVLPQVFSHDPDRLARFKREAHVLASLNHPNIAHIHGLEKSDGTVALVMELVEGPTLADRIARGPISIDEALPIARQIAVALEAAHEQGIIHRDLKPANIKVRPDGTVKVLDFGLAKALDPAGNRPDVSQSPTITSPAMTQAGMILGTAAYMSPEQASGKTVDKRADIWAFGCVMFEMLTGSAAFPGEDVSHVLARVIEREPDWTLLPSATPASIRPVVARCLVKDPRQRLRDMGDVHLALEGVFDTAAQQAPASALRVRRRERLAWAIVGVATTAMIAAFARGYSRVAPMSEQAYRSSILTPPDKVMGAVPPSRFTLSPDGRQVAFIAGTVGGRGELWTQSLSSLVAHVVPGTEGALAPFWSPDSRFVGFYADGKLKKIDTAGGPPVFLANTGPGNAGATWNRDNIVLFSTTGPRTSIRRVSADGTGEASVTELDDSRGETQHWAPFFLPDGRHFLYVAMGSNNGGPNDPNGIYVTALDSKERKLIVPGGSNAKYAQGHLFFLRDQALMAQPFDVSRLELFGDPVVIAEQVATGGLSGRMGAFSVSEAGVLAYQQGPAVDVSDLAWYDRTGKQLAALGDPADYGDVELSPNGAIVAVSRFDAAARSRDIWLVDVARGFKKRFTFDPADDATSVWSPDGDRMLFNTARKGHVDLYVKAASGAGSEDVLQSDAFSKTPNSWSQDGHFLLYTREGASTGSGLWVLPLIGDRKPFLFLQTPFRTANGMLSPNGHWIAYVSNESSGRNEVYVAAFPGPGGKWQISTGGGSWPRWRRDGAEIFFMAASRLMSALVSDHGGGSLEVGAVQPLFETRARTNRRFMYDVSADGQRFVVNALVGEAASQPITLVVNWPTLIKGDRLR